MHFLHLAHTISHCVAIELLSDQNVPCNTIKVYQILIPGGPSTSCQYRWNKKRWVSQMLLFSVLNFLPLLVVVVQSPSHVWLFAPPWTQPSCVQLFAIPWTTACQASLSLSLTISQSLPKFMSIASVIPSSHLSLWCSLLPSVFASIRDFFQWVGCSHQVTTEYKLVFSYSFPLYGKILLCSRYLLFSDRISK